MENDFAVREALIQAGRSDLIGGCEGLIPSNPPKEALEQRRREANTSVRNHHHSVANRVKGEKPVARQTPAREEQRLPPGPQVYQAAVEKWLEAADRRMRHEPSRGGTELVTKTQRGQG
ncbi:Fe-S oxidoreductase [Frigoriglobus tundricola]|uniref:Fe-S oxidoreductase n=2 Tax=Frigoriglobus tundricola TaxID=2774151 RepID=A0A6M5YYP1_9BACT|nr:Fe-S oxidoreductase [Frigoriglobus tundricola]